MTAATASATTPTSERLRQLYELRIRLDAEIRLAESIVRGEAKAAKPRQRRSKYDPIECGTEAGYQRHSYRVRKGQEEPLDRENDPCGCVAAHRKNNREQDRAVSAARRAARRSARGLGPLRSVP